ncbi:MAG TPA: efflux RND transporter permease subunit [Kofleriaceae bacterium]|nr:efflux RND transporter permease subunit [Kofleriaceae bacterium]
MERPASPIDRVIRWSIDKRLVVVLLAAAVLGYGGFTAARMPVDVFPDLTAPTVTAVTEARGLAPQEVERLVTIPIESVTNGATGVRRVRSVSGVGISIVWVEFEWGTDIYRARQIVGEKLQLIGGQLPADVGPPTLAPISSIMGEVLFIGLTSDQHDPMLLREAADWQVRKRLMSVSGVAQVMTLGGDLKQFQVLLDPRKMAQHGLTAEHVMDVVRGANANSTGGFFVRGAQESVIRGLGRLHSREDLAGLAVGIADGVPIRLGQIAEVRIGAALERGDASVNARPAVVIGVLKQPGVNTLELTERIDERLDEIQRALPEGMTIERNLLRQADFIDAAVDNVAVALRDGAILVAIILLVFLGNWRTTIISLTALPLSLAVAVIAMDALGLTINTMTLGGLTIAVGALVDDAIIDVENVFRRLRWNQVLPVENRRTADAVIYSASREIRGAIVFATLIVMLVFVPLFFLADVEGRLLVPLGFSYLVALFGSLAIALTVTPALCAYLLGGERSLKKGKSYVVRALERAYRPTLRLVLRHPWPVLGASAALLAGTLALTPLLGRTFLPEFNEGALTVSAVTLPGTSLAESDRIGQRIERALLDVPEVVSTSRRTGRSNLDEHAQAVYASELDVRLKAGARSKEAMLAAIRATLAGISGVSITIGGPISHRIDHMLSGTRASIAVKLFGPELPTLRDTAERIQRVMAGVDGAVDVSIEQQVDVPQLSITFAPDKLVRYGATPGQLAEAIETAYAGQIVTQILEGDRAFDVLVRHRDEDRADLQAIGDTLIDTPSGIKVPLRAVAEIHPDTGPHAITRENAQRKIVIMANVGGRDLGAVIDDIRAGIEARVELPEGYYVVYGGQFESEQAAKRRIAVLALLVVIGIYILLYLAFGAGRAALLIMVNLPLALIGGIIAVLTTGAVVSVGSLIGFIALFGIATRNGLMMVSHYEHLLREEHAPFDEAVERGSMERLSPVLMTALTAALALLPLVIAGDRPGNEIQAPMGIVIIGGLLTSTALNMLVLPALYSRFGRPRRPAGTGDTEEGSREN